MAKKTVTKTEAPKVRETVETTPAPTVEVVEVSAYNKNGQYVRTFSQDTHGDEFRELAEQFATKGYTLK